MIATQTKEKLARLWIIMLHCNVCRVPGGWIVQFIVCVYVCPSLEKDIDVVPPPSVKINILTSRDSPM